MTQPQGTGKTEAVFGAQATHKVREKTASAGNIWLRPEQKQTSSAALLPQLMGPRDDGHGEGHGKNRS